MTQGIMTNASYLVVLLPNIYLNLHQTELPLQSKQEYIDATIDTDLPLTAYFLSIIHHANTFQAYQILS